MKDLDEQLIKIKGMATLVGLFSFVALTLTFFFYPEKLSDVATLSLIALCLSFGWAIGLMNAKKIIDKVKQK